MRSNYIRRSSSRMLALLISFAIFGVSQTYLISSGTSMAYSTVAQRSSRSGNYFRAFQLYDSASDNGLNGRDPAIARPVSRPVNTGASAEEKLRLDTSIASCGFLKNIEEYGNARMARRAVGILSKMPSYREIPRQEHYTAAIWACENSDQYKLALSVFGEMKAAGIGRTIRTYEGLISVAEKTKNWEAAIALFEEMVSEGLDGSTDAFNSCIWAAEQGGRHDISLNMLGEMESKNIMRNLATYAACAYSCEKAGEGQIALHVMDLMRAEGYEIDTPVYKAAIWACVKVSVEVLSRHQGKYVAYFEIIYYIDKDMRFRIQCIDMSRTSVYIIFQ